MSTFQAFEQITVSSTAKSLTAGTYAAVGDDQGWHEQLSAIVSVEAADIRVRLDAVNPTAAVGHLLKAGSSFVLRGLKAIQNFRAIRAGSVDATITVTFGFGLELPRERMVKFEDKLYGESSLYDRLLTANLWNFKNMAAAATLLVKSGAGILGHITINTPTAGTVITAYNGVDATGEVIGTKTLPATILNDSPAPLVFNVACSVGICVVMGTANSDITIAYL